MALCAGLQVLHIDADRRTLHMKPDHVMDCLARHDPARTALLVDHSFGLPDPNIGRYRQRCPTLLVIEDCVRALGGEVAGAAVGQAGHWSLFSMYKTTPGNLDGAVLLTRNPWPPPSWPRARPTFRHWASGMSPLRWVHARTKRFRPDFAATARDLTRPNWMPIHGAPSRLTRRRYAHQLASLTADHLRRAEADHEIRAGLAGLAGLEVVAPLAGCRSAAFFVTFIVRAPGGRDRLVLSLLRQGFPVVWAWNTVPAFYSVLASTFPYGCAESEYLADHICHFPLVDYLTPARRKSLITKVRQEVNRE